MWFRNKTSFILPGNGTKLLKCKLFLHHSINILLLCLKMFILLSCYKHSEIKICHIIKGNSFKILVQALSIKAFTILILDAKNGVCFVSHRKYFEAPLSREATHCFFMQGSTTGRHLHVLLVGDCRRFIKSLLKSTCERCLKEWEIGGGRSGGGATCRTGMSG